MSSDSSSGEEEFEKIKEAVDEKFLPEDLYKNGSLNKARENSLKPSLRYQNHQTTSVNPFTVKVTPEFQKHVSKHLSRLLDKLIDDTEIVFKKNKSHTKHWKCGVKLLHSSKNYLVLPSEQRCSKPAVSNRKDHSDEIDFEERAKEVAVSPDWVLSKEETRHWAPDTKGEVEIIKLDSSHSKFLKNKFTLGQKNFI